jgi:very-short-patch-repair endonuclease
LRRNQTDAEKAFWNQVRNRQFLGLKFFRQYSFGPYVLDFFCSEKKLGIELDGGQHNEPDSREYDKERSEYLHAHGIDVVRFWNHEVLLDMESVLTQLREKVIS